MLEHPILGTFRLVWLLLEFLMVALGALARTAFVPRDSRALARARWLQWASRRILRVLGLQPEAYGPLPKSGLLVSNHLSYLDVLVLATITPCLFVAKQDVKSWPLFGWLARMGGTIFVSRESRMKARDSAAEIKTALDSGGLVVLFPEGTSSGGETVLPFKSALLEPAAGASHPVSAARIAYYLPGGNISEEVCYWKDMTLLPHLLHLLGKRGLRAGVCFAPFNEKIGDRKELARSLHREVTSLQVPLPAP